MIKIVKGRYGHRPNLNEPYVEVKTPKDEPFETSEELEKSLVERGIAKYVDSKVKTPVAPVQQNSTGSQGVETPPTAPMGNESGEEPPTVPTGNEGGETPPEDTLEKMTYKELQQLAKSYNIPASGTKEELIKKIKVAEASIEELEEPNLNAEKPE